MTADNSNEIKIDSLDKFKAEILKFQSEEMVYRGQSDAKWDVTSSAYRRLKLQYSNRDSIIQELLEYNKNLIERARRYAGELKETTTDLNLLAKLQHHGAATSLIDFTEAPLIALWFACQDKNTDGKVFCLDLSDPTKFLKVLPEDEEKKIEKILTLEFKENTDKILSPNYDMAKWKPSIINNRILKQDSLFIFNKEGKLNDEWFTIFILCKKNKEEILKELKQLSNFSEETIFPDFYGFAQNNGFDRPYGPQDAEAYFRKGNENFASGKYKDAIEDYNKAIELNLQHPQIVEVYYILGITNHALGQYKEAIKDYNKAIKLDPQDVEAYCGRGNAKITSGKNEEAIKDYAKAISLNPKYARAYYGLGVANHALSKFGEAIECYSKAIGLNQKYVEAYCGRGLTNHALGKPEKAIEDYSKAIKLDPQDAKAYYGLGLANHDLGKLEEAMKNYIKAKKLLEKEGSTEMVKKCEEAIEELQKTTKTDRQN